MPNFEKKMNTEDIRLTIHFMRTLTE